MKYLKLLALLSVCAVPSLAQVHGIGVQVVSQAQSGITYQVVNQGTKPLTAYTVGIDVTYADGHSFHSEESVREKPIAPGASYTHLMAYTRDAVHGEITDVRLAPLVAIYSDQTYEAVDSATYHRVADIEVSRTKAINVALKAIQQSLADGTDPRPAIEEALKESREATASPFPGVRHIVAGRPVQPDDQKLEQILADLHTINGNDAMAQYATKLRKELK
jgi:hypothetical protein